LHPVPISLLSTDVIVGLPVQLSVAVGVPTGNVVGLHPRFCVPGQYVNIGGVTSNIHVNI
jgi:hypothetical protein